MTVIVDLTCMQQFARTVSLSYRCFIAEDDKKKSMAETAHRYFFTKQKQRL